MGERDTHTHKRDHQKGTCRTAWGQDTGLHPCQPHVKRSVVCTHLAIVCYLEDDLMLSFFTLLCWMSGPCNTHPPFPWLCLEKQQGLFRVQQGLGSSRVQGSGTYEMILQQCPKRDIRTSQCWAGKSSTLIYPWCIIIYTIYQCWLVISFFFFQ